MGLLLAEGKTLKHLKEKPQHKTPCNNLISCGEKPAAEATDQRNFMASCATA
jgi:hypothetical protein